MAMPVLLKPSSDPFVHTVGYYSWRVVPLGVKVDWEPGVYSKILSGEALTLSYSKSGHSGREVELYCLS